MQKNSALYVWANKRRFLLGATLCGVSFYMLHMSAVYAQQTPPPPPALPPMEAVDVDEEAIPSLPKPNDSAQRLPGISDISDIMPIAEPSPAAPPQKTEPVEAPSAKAPVQPSVQEVASINKEQPLWSGTLMFDAKRHADMNEYYRLYQERKGTPEESSVIERLPDYQDKIKTILGGSEEKQIVEEVLQFTLNSIVFYSDSDWSVWVNGVRYSPEDARNGINIGSSSVSVTDVSKNAVNFLWVPIVESFEIVEKNWDAKQQAEKSPDVAVNEFVEMDGQSKTVTILMRPNQTFVSKYMSVVEGSNKGTVRTQKPKEPIDIEVDNPDEGAETEQAPQDASGTLSEIKKMPAGDAKTRAIADGLSQQYLNAMPGMTEQIKNGGQP